MAGQAKPCAVSQAKLRQAGRQAGKAGKDNAQASVLNAVNVGFLLQVAGKHVEHVDVDEDVDEDVHENGNETGCGA